MNRTIETVLSNAADTAIGSWPRRRPTRAQLQQARIISHRGAHDNIHLRENTLAAFDAAVATGVHGIEFDVRYTADGEPVVTHDDNLSRVFDTSEVVAATRWATLHQHAPEVPHVEMLLERYAGRAHLMLELKARAPNGGEARLLRLLQTLDPGRDFHILTLDDALFTAVQDLPARCQLPVAKLNTGAMLNYALSHDCAGLAGPYLLLGAHYVTRLQAAGRQIGTGFVNNRGILWREIARGVDWMFSSRAAELQTMLNRARSD